MANIRKRGAKWQATVRRKGVAPQIKTFFKKDDAVRWARQQETALDKGIIDPQAHVKALPFLGLIDRYEAEITPAKRSRHSETAHLRQIKRHAISQIHVLKITPEHVAQFRDERLKSVSSPTVRKELTLIGVIFGLAAREWGLVGVANPVTSVKKPPHGRARDRRLSKGEEEQLMTALKQCRNPVIVAAIRFAIATAMRRSEILRLTWANIDFKTCTALLDLTKNGERRIVPLSPEALKALYDRKAESDERSPESVVFPISANALRLAWERTCQRAGLVDLHFHDLRHEAISRFFEIGLSVPEVALISGHKDARMLFRYTHLRPEAIAKKLASKPIKSLINHTET